MVQALSGQASALIHTSNLYYTEPQGRLAKRLVELVGSPGKVFFSNSGAEANEALFKVARKYGNDCRSTPQEIGTKVEILTFESSFHGRTMAGISATGQEKVKIGFAPLLSGFRHLPFNDLAAVEKAVSGQTVGILLEAFQGESGIYPASREFLIGLRRLCDEHQILLMCDEIQCGLGRVGNWCGWKAIAPEVVPDAVSWAKGIGGGFPLGATWLRAKPIRKSDGSQTQLCDLLQPGSHGTTYGGTPLACAVSLAVLQTIEDDHLVERAAKLGRFATGQIKKIRGVREVRGQGLMIGIDLVSGSRLIARVAWKPFKPGITTSIKIRSGFNCFDLKMASSPLSLATTSKPALVSMSFSTCRSVGESSTISILRMAMVAALV